MSKKQKVSLITVVFISFLATFSIPSCITGPHRFTPPVHFNFSPTISKGSLTALKVMTLNLAHGRKEGFHQLFQDKTTIQANLTEIARILRREKPDIVALQEADNDSFWSGNFNHIYYLAEKARFSYSIQGEQIKGLGLSYGTGLLSKFPLTEAISITFTPTPPTPAKGFVVSTINIGTEINVVSVHLDFARASVRQRQIEEMVNDLKPFKRPLIIMGDFNCDWSSENTLPFLAKALNLQVFQPEASNLNTFPQWWKETRIDWILISSELDFSSYRVMEDRLSDHFAVIATLKFRKKI